LCAQAKIPEFLTEGGRIFFQKACELNLQRFDVRLVVLVQPLTVWTQTDLRS
jgi:hypothetical protein